MTAYTGRYYLSNSQKMAIPIVLETPIESIPRTQASRLTWAPNKWCLFLVIKPLVERSLIATGKITRSNKRLTAAFKRYAAYDVLDLGLLQHRY